ncbi:MAG TPA: thioredoxin domain-containing protein, partial [Cytophagales bacterium]|nr:thioredoxin domain-containing protein [Cytophagales bacterium]
TKGMNEVVIVGEKAEEIRVEMQKKYLPFALTLGTKSESKLPLFEGRDVKNETMIYVCRNKVCQLPVNDVEKAIEQIIQG